MFVRLWMCLSLCVSVNVCHTVLHVPRGIAIQEYLHSTHAGIQT